ncbi:hypothetical protein L228DRAFT_268959 [Xylona heveae TC161]|uniref:Uncharacterized protein n=1 Tax=Xylona heveae (strain CBS 132557 / TC161) TaxID=1328760 RepID=A0A165FWX6_XYLHT|nr:hypothetical protein L228DRAFT_268959 [Xylona heveae TC161]KZF21483.1 hypothetical protein L228DRAFT_268959 [Xylona heveae TC161]
MPVVPGNAFSEQASRKPANTSASDGFETVDNKSNGNEDKADDGHHKDMMPRHRRGTAISFSTRSRSRSYAPVEFMDSLAPPPLEPRRPQVVQPAPPVSRAAAATYVPVPLDANQVNQNEGRAHRRNRAYTDPAPSSGRAKHILQQSKQFMAEIKSKLHIGSGHDSSSKKNDFKHKLLPVGTSAKVSAVLGVKIDKCGAGAAKDNTPQPSSSIFPPGPYYGRSDGQASTGTVLAWQSPEPSSRFFNENVNGSGQNNGNVPLPHEAALGVYGPPQAQALILSHGIIAPCRNGGYGRVVQVAVTQQPRHIASMAAVIDHVRDEQHEEEREHLQLMQPQTVDDSPPTFPAPTTAEEYPICYSPSIYDEYDDGPPPTPVRETSANTLPTPAEPGYDKAEQQTAPINQQQHDSEHHAINETHVNGLESVDTDLKQPQLAALERQALESPLAGVAFTDNVPFPPDYQGHLALEQHSNLQKSTEISDFSHPLGDELDNQINVSSRDQDWQGRQLSEGLHDIRDIYDALDDHIKHQTDELEHTGALMAEKTNKGPDTLDAIQERLEKLMELREEHIRLLHKLKEHMQTQDFDTKNSLPSAMKGGRDAAARLALTAPAVDERAGQRVRFAEAPQIRRVPGIFQQLNDHAHYSDSSMREQTDVVQNPRQAPQYLAGQQWYRHHMAYDHSSQN